MLNISSHHSFLPNLTLLALKCNTKTYSYHVSPWACGCSYHWLHVCSSFKTYFFKAILSPKAYLTLTVFFKLAHTNCIKYWIPLWHFILAYKVLWIYSPPHYLASLLMMTLRTRVETLVDRGLFAYTPGSTQDLCWMVSTLLVKARNATAGEALRLFSLLRSSQ